MQQVSQTANELTRTYSQNPQSSISTTTSNLSREQHAALFAVINKARLLNGWTTRTAQELDATIRTWAEVFAEYQIPTHAYPELYKRAFDVRQTKMQLGLSVPQMDATLLVSQWTGAFGLKAAWRQKEIEAGRTLGANAESVCSHCFGTGFRSVEGGVKRCDHENI